MAAAVSPFSTDHAVKFAQELLGFLSSNLSITGHDLFVFGEDVQPSQAHQNRQSGVVKKRLVAVISFCHAYELAFASACVKDFACHHAVFTAAACWQTLVYGLVQQQLDRHHSFALVTKLLVYIKKLCQR